MVFSTRVVYIKYSVMLDIRGPSSGTWLNSSEGEMYE